MHNLKDLRKNLEIYKNKFKNRNLTFNTLEFDEIDKFNRELNNKDIKQPNATAAKPYTAGYMS